MSLLFLLLTVCGAAWTEEDHTQDEIQIGRTGSARFERKHSILDSGTDVAHLQGIINRLAKVTERPDLPYTVKIVQGDDVNAITFPGGFIYVYTGLLSQHLDEDALAGILAHEITHAVKAHGYHHLLQIMVLKKLAERFNEKAGIHSDNVKALEALGEDVMTRGLGRRAEDEADRWGLHYAAKAGYDPKGLLRVMEMLLRLEKSKPTLIERLASSHPPTADRIVKIKAELKTMGIR